MARKRRNQPTADRLASENAVMAGQPDEFSVDKFSASEPQDFDSRDERLYRDVEKLHQLGPRPLFEFLNDLGRNLLIRVQIERRVARYARLDPATVRLLRGDKFHGRPCCNHAESHCTAAAAASPDAITHDPPTRDVGAEGVAIPGRIESRLEDIGAAEPGSPAKRKPHGR